MNIFLGTLRYTVPVMTMLLCATMVQAHTGDGPHNGWLHGFLHPLNGLDHLLAMIAVGIWSMQLSNDLDKRAIWLMPFIFVVVMGLGGVLGLITVSFVFAEHGIALSLLITGFLIARAIHLSIPASAILIAVFAVFHGYAHGSEIPEGTAIVDYAAGFMLATALLHLVGIGLATLLYRVERDQWLRYAGVAVALSGGVMLVGGTG